MNVHRSCYNFGKFVVPQAIVDLFSGHASRILTMAQSPDQSIVASASADQTIRIWNCFAAEKKKTKVKAKGENMSRLMRIR